MIAKIYKNGEAIPFRTTIEAVSGLSKSLNDIITILKGLDEEFECEIPEKNEPIMYLNEGVYYGYVTMDSILFLEDILTKIEAELDKLGL